jgi:hypothetical protein
MTFTILSRYREVAAISRKAAIKRRSDPQLRALLWQVITVSRPAFPSNARTQDALRLSQTIGVSAPLLGKSLQSVGLPPWPANRPGKRDHQRRQFDHRDIRTGIGACFSDVRVTPPKTISTERAWL